MEINLLNYMLGAFQVMLCTMRCAHGSNCEILSEWALDLSMLSRGYVTLVDQATPLDQAFLFI